MSSQPWYPMYVGDWRSKTSHLSLAEKGAYLELLNHGYSVKGGLPNDLQKLCRICGADHVTEITVVKAIIAEFFTLEKDGLLHNKRSDKELIKLKDFSEEQSRKGKLSAQARWGNRGLTDANSVVTGGVTGGVTESNQPHPQSQVNQESADLGGSFPQTPSSSSFQLDSSPENGARKNAAGKINGEQPTAATWAAYSAAYSQRWGTQPVRNKQVNSQIKNFVERIGAIEAPGVAAFYVSSNRGLYVSAKHPCNLLLRDAEGLRTEWATGRQVMETEAHLADKKQATGNVFTKLISEADKL
jgi:uncharacterized protein YdaU (DUF1376 family)